MRQVASLALMTAILAAMCSCAVTDGGKAQEQALELRTKYISAESYELTAKITADYGDRLFEYVICCVGDGDTCELKVLEPESIAGLMAEVTDGGLEISYDGAELSAGALDGDGLEPAGAVPLMISMWQSGYISGAVYEKYSGSDTLKVTYRVTDGETLQTWFFKDSGMPMRAEILSSGRRVIACEFNGAKIS